MINQRLWLLVAFLVTWKIDEPNPKKNCTMTDQWSEKKYSITCPTIVTKHWRRFKTLQEATDFWVQGISPCAGISPYYSDPRPYDFKIKELS